MVDRPALWFRLLGSLFRPVQFADDEVDKIQGAHRTGHVVFVLRSESLLDYLYFNWAFLRKGLPLAGFGQGMPMWPWRALRSGAGRLWKRLFRKTLPDAEAVTDALHRGQPVLLFLQRARSVLPFVRRTPVDLVAVVAGVSAQSAGERAPTPTATPGTSDAPILFVPLMIVWERGQNRLKRSIFDAVFGDYETPGRARKLINFVGGHRIAFVRVGEPIGPVAMAGDGGAATGGVPPERLRYELESAFRAEERVIKGPITKTSADVRSEMMRTDAMQTEVRSLAEHTGKAPLEVKAEVETSLAEIAADMRPGWVEFMCYVLNFVFGRIYGGLEVDDLHAVRETAKRMPLIVLPSHKSHLDYLLISYLFYTHGILPPHIAAGANLNFWPMGHIFRHTGAFFIRRSFRQDEVYSRTLKAYLQKLLKDGRSVEFFLEGTRSRTGKLLKPKYGLLGHVIDAVAHGQVHDVALCPTAVGYELIVEGQSYARELSGARKESESLGQLVNAALVLRERFGRVHVSFAPPFSVREFLAEQGVDSGHGFTTDAQRREVTKRIAYKVLGGINGAVRVTASSVVAWAVLGAADRGLSRSTIHARVGALVDYLLRRDIALASGLLTLLSVSRLPLVRAPALSDARAETLAALDGSTARARAFGAAPSAATDEALKLFQERRHLSLHRFESVGPGHDAEVFEALPERRVFLDYYKNYLVHTLAREGVLALAAIVCEREGRQARELEDEARFLSALLKNEYVFETGFQDSYRGTVDEFTRAGLVYVEPDGQLGLVPSGLTTMELLAAVTVPVVEGYYVVAHAALDRSLFGLPAPEAQKRLLEDGGRRWHVGEIGFREAVSSAVFDNAIAWLEESGFVTTENRPQGRRSVKIYGPGPKLQESPKALRDVLARMRRYVKRAA